jgi:hypothetical protein
MKALNPRNNGMPLEAEDVEFLQTAIREIVKGQHYGRNCVLQGCDLSKNGTDFEIAEGWVLVDGEVYYVPSHTVVDNDGSGNKSYDATNYNFSHKDLGSNSFLQNFAYEEQVEYDPLGDENFADGVNRDTYEIRTMEGRYQVDPGPQPGDANYLSIAGRTQKEVLLHLLWDRIGFPEAKTADGLAGYKKDILREYSYKYVSGGIFTSGNAENIQFTWTFGVGVPANSNSWSDTDGPILRQDQSRLVRFSQGTIDGSSVPSSTDSVWHDGSAVPSNMKPNGTKYIAVPAKTTPGNSPSIGTLVVNTDGSMELYNANLDQEFVLDGATYDPNN